MHWSDEATVRAVTSSTVTQQMARKVFEVPRSTLHTIVTSMMKTW